MEGEPKIKPSALDAISKNSFTGSFIKQLPVFIQEPQPKHPEIAFVSIILF